ncbi:MAG: GreA/GreB family elongation factor [Chloroflexi bacterium]|nr:GreA/GreB family elongation factor [Chloroflexota bacterium]
MKIAPGTSVMVELIAKNKTREQLHFVLVADDAADFDKGLLGVGTPLAKTILGHAAGETLPYTRGDIVQVEILQVQRAEDAPRADVAGQRDQALRRARDNAELANMVSFALTFDSKGGDYNLDMFDVATEHEQVADPEQIVKQYKENQDKDQAHDKGDAQ